MDELFFILIKIFTLCKLEKMLVGLLIYFKIISKYLVKELMC